MREISISLVSFNTYAAEKIDATATGRPGLTTEDTNPSSIPASASQSAKTPLTRQGLILTRLGA